MSGIAATERLLCHLSDLPEGESRGFPPVPGGFTGLFESVAIRPFRTVFKDGAAV